MLSISEAEFAADYGLEVNDLPRLWREFQRIYPYNMRVMLNQKDYRRMLADEGEVNGLRHPHTSFKYSDAYNWAIYEPHSVRTHCEASGVCNSFSVGFRFYRDACFFKLKWFQS